MTKLIFVYGTLKKGHYNHYILEHDNVKFLGDATLNDYAMWKIFSYPAIYPESNYNVKGEVYEVPEDIFDEINELETMYNYHPETVSVTTNSQTHDDVIVFVWNRKPNEFEIIKDGNF